MSASKTKQDYPVKPILCLFYTVQDKIKGLLEELIKEDKEWSIELILECALKIEEEKYKQLNNLSGGMFWRNSKPPPSNFKLDYLDEQEQKKKILKEQNKYLSTHTLEELFEKNVRDYLGYPYLLETACTNERPIALRALISKFSDNSYFPVFTKYDNTIKEVFYEQKYKNMNLENFYNLIKSKIEPANLKKEAAELKEKAANLIQEGQEEVANLKEAANLKEEAANLKGEEGLAKNTDKMEEYWLKTYGNTRSEYEQTKEAITKEKEANSIEKQANSILKERGVKPDLLGLENYDEPDLWGLENDDEVVQLREQAEKLEGEAATLKEEPAKLKGEAAELKGEAAKLKEEATLIINACVCKINLENNTIFEYAIVEKAKQQISKVKPNVDMKPEPIEPIATKEQIEKEKKKDMNMIEFLIKHDKVNISEVFDEDGDIVDIVYKGSPLFEVQEKGKLKRLLKHENARTRWFFPYPRILMPTQRYSRSTAIRLQAQQKTKQKAEDVKIDTQRQLQRMVGREECT